MLVMITTIPVTKKCLKILLEETPEHIQVQDVMRDIWATNADQEQRIIQDVHNLHIWSLSVNKIALTVHIETTDS